MVSEDQRLTFYALDKEETLSKLRNVSTHMGTVPSGTWTLLLMHDARNDQWIRVSYHEGEIHFNNLGGSGDRRNAHIPRVVAESGTKLDMSVPDRSGEPLLRTVKEYLNSVRNKIVVDNRDMAQAEKNNMARKLHVPLNGMDAAYSDDAYMAKVIETATSGQSVVPYQKLSLYQHYQLNASMLGAIADGAISQLPTDKELEGYYVMFVETGAEAKTGRLMQETQRFRNFKPQGNNVEAIIVTKGEGGVLKEAKTYSMSAYRFCNELPYEVDHAQACDLSPKKSAEPSR